MLIKKQRQITLREMQDAAKTAYDDSKGLFKESEVSEILTELQLGSDRSIRKIVRECGKFATKYRDMATMLDTITDFFIDNEKNFLQANSVLNGRTYNPLENYDRREEGYTDSSSETHGIGARETTVTRGKVKNTNTPGKVKSVTTDIDKPAVIGMQASGSSGNKVKEYESTTETEQLTASVSETEQLTADSTEQEAAEDTVEREDVHAARRAHGNIGVTTSQQMATAELKLISKFASTLDFIIYLFKQNCIIPVYLDDVNEYGYHYDFQGNIAADPGTEDAFDPGANPPTSPNITPEPIPDAESAGGTTAPTYFYIDDLQGYAPVIGDPVCVILSSPFISDEVLSNDSDYYPTGNKIIGDVVLPGETKVKLSSHAISYFPYMKYLDNTTGEEVEEALPDLPDGRYGYDHVLTVSRDCKIIWKYEV